MNIKLNISEQDTIDMISDIAKFLTILVVYHLLYNTLDLQETDLFNEQFLKMLIYVTLGILVYSLFIKKIFIPAPKKEKIDNN